MDVRLGVWGEELGLPLLQRPQVELGAGNEVLGLTDVHPEAIEVKRVQLTVPDHGREGLLLNGGWAQVNAIEHRGVEDVDAGVDAVADELDGLLDEALDAGRVAGLMHNDTILGRLLDFCDTDGALVAVLLVECDELLERVLASNIRVEDEEWSVVLEKGIGSQLQWASSAQGLCLDREGDVDPEALRVLGEEATVRASSKESISRRDADRHSREEEARLLSLMGRVDREEYGTTGQDGCWGLTSDRAFSMISGR